MQPQNDATVSGTALRAALNRVLPRGRLPARLRLVIGPDGPGSLVIGCAGPLAVSYEAIPARGVWSDIVETSALFLRAWLARETPPTVRLVFYGQALAVNGTTVTALTMGAAAAAEAAAEQLADIGRWRITLPPDALALFRAARAGRR